MASLVFHYQRLLRLDDPSITTKEQAAAVLGMKSAGGARFPLEAARRLGTDGLREALGLLAQAELDLRGQSGLDERTAIDVLVARLAALSRRHARGTSRAGAAVATLAKTGQSAADALCARFIRREVRRAAWFLWMMPVGRGLVEALLRGLHQLLPRRRRSVVDRGGGDLHPRLQLGAHGLVAVAPPLVLPVALLLRLDVGHVTLSRPSGTGSRLSGGSGAGPRSARQPRE